MSPYGEIARPTLAAPLAPRTFSLGRVSSSISPSPSPSAATTTTTTTTEMFLTVVHVRCKVDAIPHELVVCLRDAFNEAIVEGRTYPQEDAMSTDEFKAYFLAYDLFLGILDGSATGEGPRTDTSASLSDLVAGRSWADAILGFNYVKPNYPSRSAHVCNAGFVVPVRHRGMRAGLALGRAFVQFAPLLGYSASVFNLVYASNAASLRIWDKLGFQRVGLIPKAGRLKRPNNNNGQAGEQEEDFVDAVVYYREFATQ